MLNPARPPARPFVSDRRYPRQPTHTPGPGSKTSPLGGEKIGRFREWSSANVSSERRKETMRVIGFGPRAAHERGCRKGPRPG